MSRRLSWARVAFFSDRSWVAFSISAARRWLKARIWASAWDSRSSIWLNPCDSRPTSSTVSTGMRRDRSPPPTSRMAPASTSRGLPIMRWVMRPETKVSTMSSRIEKMIEIRSSVFSIDSTAPSVHFMTSVAFHGPCRSTSSSIGCSCASPCAAAGESERLARERREAGDLGAIAARRDDAARGGVRLAVDVEIEAHDARVAVEVAEQLLLEVAVVGVGLDALQILGDVVGELLGAGLRVLDDPVAGERTCAPTTRRRPRPPRRRR